MLEIAFGELNIKPDDYWDLTPLEFHYKLKGWQKFQQRQLESEWERTRWMTWTLLQPHTKKGAFKNPIDLVRFPWEKSKEIETEKLNIDRSVKDWMKQMDEDHIKKMKEAINGNTSKT